MTNRAVLTSEHTMSHAGNTRINIGRTAYLQRVGHSHADNTHGML